MLAQKHLVSEDTDSKLQLKEYTSNANEVIQFKLITSESDLVNEQITFSPIFTHQIFEEETIYGYKNLKIKYYVTCGDLSTFVSIEHSGSLDNKCDDVIEKLSKSIKHGFITNIDLFTQKISDDVNFKPYGILIKKYSLKSDENKEKHFEIYKSTISNDGFIEYYKRLQTFILFFIDAGSFIDIDDDKWSYYLIYERLESKKYSVAGYLTYYSYYAYPDKIRARISQVLILPPYQRNGHCTYLLQSVYDDLIADNSIIDITVECPSNNFVKVRDYVDVKNFINLKEFNSDNFKKISNKYYKEFKPIIKENLKLSKYQSRRVYEIVCLKYLDTNNEEDYKKYKLEIKQRIKNKNSTLRKAAKESLKSNTYDQLSDKQKIKKYMKLETNSLISFYREVLDRFDYECN